MEGFNIRWVFMLTFICFSQIFLCYGIFDPTKVKCPKNVEQLTGLKNMMGAWSKVKSKDVEGDTFIMVAVQSSLATSNAEKNGDQKKVISTSDIRNVYTQLVNGLNYCITFRAVPANCKGNEECSNMEYFCEVGAYRPFNYGQLVGGEPVGFDYGDVICGDKRTRPRIII